MRVESVCVGGGGDGGVEGEYSFLVCFGCTVAVCTLRGLSAPTFLEVSRVQDDHRSVMRTEICQICQQNMCLNAVT